MSGRVSHSWAEMSKTRFYELRECLETPMRWKGSDRNQKTIDIFEVKILQKVSISGALLCPAFNVPQNMILLGEKEGAKQITRD